MLTHVPGYNVTTDSIRSKTVKDSYVKWDAGVLVNAVTTTNSSLTLDNSHDSFYINNANAATISVTILNTINDYTANSNNSLRRVNVIIDSRSAASDRTVTFTLPSTFTLLGGLSATRNLYHGNLQVFVVEIVNNTVNIYDGVGSYFEVDSNGDLMPLNSSADLVPRTDLSGQLGTGDKRWAKVYAGNITNTYDNVAAMVADTSLKEGGTAFTKGYHNPNDGGAGVYNIRVCGSGEPESCDNGSTISLTNGNVAELIHENTVNVKQFGAYGNGTTTDDTAFQNIATYASSKNLIMLVPPATYKVTATITGTFGTFGDVTITGGGTVNIVNLKDVADDAQDSADAAATSESNALSYRNAAQTSAAAAAASASDADTTATALTNFLATKETLTAPAIDSTLTISGAAADAKVTGEKLTGVSTDIDNICKLGDFKFAKNWSLGTAVSPGGAIQPNEKTFALSDYISVNQYDILEYTGETTDGVNDYQCLAGVYNSSKEFVGRIVLFSPTGNTPYTMPYDGYVRIMFGRHSSTGVTITYDDIEKCAVDFPKRYVQTEGTASNLLRIPYKWSLRTAVSGYGDVQLNEKTFALSDYISVNQYDILKYIGETTDGVNDYHCLAVLYNSSKVFVTRTVLFSPTGNTPYTMPYDGYVRIMFGRHSSTGVTITYDDIEKCLLESPKLLAMDVKKVFVNVEKYGAVHDGSTNDTPAIQNAINSCSSTGGTIYFPAGVYAIKSSSLRKLQVYSNQRLLFEQGAVLKVMTNSMGHIINTYNENSDTGYDGCTNVIIEGAILDLNGYDEDDNPDGVTATITGITTSHADRITIKDCVFINGYSGGEEQAWHYIELNSTKNATVANCYFNKGHCIEAVQLDAAIGAGNQGQNDGTVCKDILFDGNTFEMLNHTAIGNHTDAAHENIRICNNVFKGGSDNRGYIYTVPRTHAVDVYNNTFRDGTIGIDITHSTPDSTIHDNRFENCTEAIHTSQTSYNNIVDGVLVN